MARLRPSRGLAAPRARSRPSRPRAGVRGACAPQLPRLRVVRARRAVRRCRGGAARVRRVRANQAGGGGPGVSLAAELAERGEIGGRTVRITENGAVECHVYPLGPLTPGMVRVRTELSVISPGTEMTYIGGAATNPYLHKTWDPELRIFAAGAPTQDYPIVFGYRAAGTVIASSDADLPPGTRVFGKWRHTEFTALSLADARAQLLPSELSFEDGADLAQMLPIAVNAVAYAEERHAGAPTVVFGCGPVGLILAQVARATGATTVYAVDRIAQRLAIAKSLGLVALDPAAEDVARKLKGQHGADGVPVAFECSGSARARDRRRRRLLSRRGRRSLPRR